MENRLSVDRYVYNDIDDLKKLKKPSRKWVYHMNKRFYIETTGKLFARIENTS